MAINPKHMKKRYFVLKGTNLFYFKGEASGGSNTPVGSPLSVVPLEFSLLEVEGQPTETASGKPLFAINLKVSPEFWPRSKHKTYLLGLKSQEAQMAWASALREASIPRPNLVQSITEMGLMEAVMAQQENVIRIHHLKTPTFSPKPAQPAGRVSEFFAQPFRPRASQAAMAAAPQRHTSIFGAGGGSDFKPGNVRLSLSQDSMSSCPEDGIHVKHAAPPKPPLPLPRSPSASAPPSPPPPPVPVMPSAPKPPPPPMMPQAQRQSAGPLVKPSADALQAEIERRKSRTSGVSAPPPPKPAEQSSSSGKGLSSKLHGMFKKTNSSNQDGMPAVPTPRAPSPAPAVPPAPAPRSMPPPPPPPAAGPPHPVSRPASGIGGGLVKPSSDALQAEIARRASRKSESQPAQAQSQSQARHHAPVQTPKRVLSRGGSFGGGCGNTQPVVPQTQDFSSELQNALQNSLKRRASKDSLQTPAAGHGQQQSHGPPASPRQLQRSPSSNGYTPPSPPPPAYDYKSTQDADQNNAFYTPHVPSLPISHGQTPGGILGITSDASQKVAAASSSPTSTLAMHQEQSPSPQSKSPAKNFMERLNEMNKKSQATVAKTSPPSRVGDIVIGKQPWQQRAAAQNDGSQRKSSSPADLLGIPSNRDSGVWR